MSTYELILLTLKGDQNAARALVKILTPIFHKEAQYAIWRVRGTLEDVKELINDIFADLFADQAARLRRFDPEKGASPEGYFRRFARLRCMGFARDERDRLLERLTEPGDLSELHAGPSPEAEQIQGLDAQTKLKQIAQALPPADFEIFRRRYLEYQETEEICAAMSLSRDVYFQRVHRLIARLQQQGLLEKEYRGRKTTGPRIIKAKPEPAGPGGE
jgi:RNA polymerase sigma factor (sigma-70 family)